MNIERVQNSHKWDRYQRQRDLIRTRLTNQDRQNAYDKLDPDVRTSLVDISVLPHLEEDVLERWLFHGTTSTALESITNSGFDNERSGSHAGTLYGKGIYCAGCSSKADEYTEPNKDGLRGILLCRATLGKLHYVDDLRPTPSQLRPAAGHDTILGDRWNAAGTFREFVLSNSDQVYPEYILYYRRVF